MECIKITKLKIFAHHGVYPFETAAGQNFYVNARLYLDLKQAGRSDMLEQSVNYSEVCLFLERFLTEHTYKLLETACYETLKALLQEFTMLEGAQIELCKPEAPISQEFGNVSVVMEMKWHKVYIGIGSNIGDKRGYIREALDSLQKDDSFRKIRCSTLIETKPYGNVEQDDFVNGVIEAETVLEPFALLDKLHTYEADAHRERNVHWGPRTLDLDILLYDTLVLDSERLVIPHCDMANRDFVLTPLKELAPYVRHPLTGQTVGQMWEALENG